MWPEYYPENCPPNEARKETLEVYRLVDNNPPVKKDFLPSIIEYPNRQFPDICLACGVSVFTDIRGTKRTKKRYKALRNKKIAKGKIFKDDGLILETLSKYHITWWLQTEEPHITFTEIFDDAIT